MISLANVKKLLFCGLVIFSIIFLFSQFSTSITAEPNCSADVVPKDDIDYCLDVIDKELKALEPAHEYNKKELASLRKQLDSLNKRITGISTQLDNLQVEIIQREEDLAFAQEIFELKTNNHYKFLRLYDPLLPFLSSDASEAFREINFRQKAADEDRRTMEVYAQDLYDLKQDKEELEKNQAFLAAAKKQVDERESFLAGEVEKVEAYIATLTARQQQFLAQKLGSLNLPKTLGSGPLFCVNDRDQKYDPGFRPAFAFFTYGIPHRVGMNQYGAYGRASSQDYKTILTTYYQNVRVECRDLPPAISVEGYGGRDFEEYTKGVVNKEMGADIPEALKAQAVAARSYAINETNNGQISICSSQSCQVYSDARRGAANDAVDATGKNICGSGKGEVLVSNSTGQVIKAWYASTAGGYTFTSADVWGGGTSWTRRLRDTTGGVSSFSDLQSTAYDKDSPCFYAAQGWREDYASSAWLKSEEVADIANAILLSRADSSTREHLYQTDKSHPYGGEIWSEERVKSELRDKNITPFNNVSGVSISADFGGGRTTNVSVSGDAGTQSFSGEEFKNFFNLRAPANIQIVGPLYNIEKK